MNNDALAWERLIRAVQGTLSESPLLAPAAFVERVLEERRQRTPGPKTLTAPELVHRPKGQVVRQGKRPLRRPRWRANRSACPRVVPSGGVPSGHLIVVRFR